MTKERFFVSESVRHARTMSYTDCISFLEGMLLTCGDTESVSTIREAMVQITASDHQLELIAEERQ